MADDQVQPQSTQKCDGETARITAESIDIARKGGKTPEIFSEHIWPSIWRMDFSGLPADGCIQKDMEAMRRIMEDDLENGAMQQTLDTVTGTPIGKLAKELLTGTEQSDWQKTKTLAKMAWEGMKGAWDLAWNKEKSETLKTIRDNTLNVPMKAACQVGYASEDVTPGSIPEYCEPYVSSKKDASQER